MTIGEVSERFKINVSTLRYYERIGLLNNVPRNKNGIRNYNDETIQKIDLILCMRKAGLSIELLLDYFDLCDKGEDTMIERMGILLKQRDILIPQIEELTGTLNRLNQKIDTYKKKIKGFSSQK